jgi:O-antigen ligase
LLIAVVVVLSESQTAQLAFLVAMVLGALVALFPRSCRFLFVGLAMAVLVFPWSMQLLNSNIPPAMESFVVKQAHANHRIAIWQGYSDLIAEKPAFGWGMKADRALGLNGRATRNTEKNGLPEETTSPHNFILEIWVNLGVVGALLVALLLVMIGRQISRLPRLQMVVATQISVSIFTISLVGSSLMQGWWLASICIAAVVYWTFSSRQAVS